MAAIDPRDASRVMAKIRNLGKNRTDDVHKAMWSAAEQLLHESQKYVPVETGKLKASGRVRVDGTGLDINAYVIYGGVGFGINYARWVHEDPTKAHGQAYNIKYSVDIFMGRKKAKRPEESFKYLEKAIRLKREEIRRALQISLGPSRLGWHH